MKLFAYALGFGLLLNGLLGCVRPVTVDSQALSPSQPPKTTAAAPVPQLLFLSCRLIAEATGSRLQVLRLEAVPGHLKKLAADDHEMLAFVRVSQLDGQGQALTQTRVVHPLYHDVEHVADDRRIFRRSEVKLPAAEFFVRLTLQPAATTLRVEEVAGGKTTLLTELPLAHKP